LYSVADLVDGTFLLAPTSNNIPGRLRVADVDMDGFPDIAMTVLLSNLTTQSIILNNFDGNATDSTPR
jgi:hypothetical protein